MIEYSKDWTTPHVCTWTDVLTQHMTTDREPIKMIEIGCYEGQSTAWFLENVLIKEEDRIYVIDPHIFEPETSEERFFQSVKSTNAFYKVVKFKEKSGTILPKITTEFDIIYIDGDHEGEHVLLDALNCFPLCKSDGIIIFDDYAMPKSYHNDDEGLHWDHKNSVKDTVDIFLNLFKDRLKIISTGSQMIVQKI